MNFKKTYTPAQGYTPICRIGECSLGKLEFGIIELDAGKSLSYETQDREVAFIMLEGHCNVTVGETRWEKIGNRANVFENRRAESFYLPREASCVIEAIDRIAGMDVTFQQYPKHDGYFDELYGFIFDELNK